jgi:mannose-6-phosphate isomerase class I
VIGDGTLSVECSLDALLWQETDAVLGAMVAARYGSYFPIRFDYLDTMGGTNLSCQVHPRLDYIRDEFGEPFTQDETYYIVTCEPGSRVFLGLQDDASLDRFKDAAVAARDRGSAFDINTHVYSVPSAPGDLFLIPSGTVHCSGANNLVLEISATPYIYTFKIYDYLRTDLRGNLRHVHLDHAFANLDPSRRARWVQSHLCPRPVAIRQGSDWAEYRIGDIERLFFAIHRLEFTHTIDDETNGRFLALNLVAGERCAIDTVGHEPVELRFAESIVIPARVHRYTLRNLGDTPCKVVKAFVKG